MTRSAQTSPFFPAWVSSTRDDYGEARAAVAGRDFSRLAELAEHSCLKMHAVMLSSMPGMVYWRPATVAAIEAVRALQKEDVPVFFTIDAGPQVKAVCLQPDADAIEAALQTTPGVIRTLRSSLGNGARLIDT